MRNRLKELRESHCLMAKDIANLLGMTYRNYQRYENNQVDIPASKLTALADYFQVSVDYLLCRTNNPHTNQ